MSAEITTGIWTGTTVGPATDGSTFDVHDPATGEIIAEVADATVDDALAALGAAHEAQDAWAATTARHRSVVLADLARAVSARSEELAPVLSREMGKPLREAAAEVANTAEFFRWYAGEAERLPGRYADSPGGQGRILVTRRPVGPCLAITPWNFPLSMAARKIAPALAAGCTVVVKPAAETPLVMLKLGEILARVFGHHEVPDGVVSIVPTTDAAALSSALMGDPRLRKVTFTGSTAVGRTLVRQSADLLLRTSMELGGNAPFVVAADADLDAAVDGAVAAKTRNAGQVCVAANRFIVVADVVEEFTARLAERFDALPVGPGSEPGTEVGPLVTSEAVARVSSLVDAAVAAGARQVTARTRADVPGEGYFYPPTVLADVPAGADVLNTEIFGPVATVSVAGDLEEAIAAANDTDAGLAAYGYSASAAGVEALAGRLKAGMVAVNRVNIADVAAPFGGVDQSGFGREGGTEGIEEYLDARYVALP
ncbi:MULTISPECIES: aldehyde dehydrogenase family protein [Corynebacterium]|uniref:aldehyde dehydrogenase family protein n=1 Tax=Corynebacterium TaxID=1716 RepID=UPI00255118EC|nr:MULTISPECIES: aldehyde dehydrogenase family protein [Corynebacterium]MDK8896160.1 aldehyde dehydrogenase family protein [Corynebacterium sp. MSK006]